MEAVYKRVQRRSLAGIRRAGIVLVVPDCPVEDWQDICAIWDRLGAGARDALGLLVEQEQSQPRRSPECPTS
jgi:hypothetical protein